MKLTRLSKTFCIILGGIVVFYVLWFLLKDTQEPPFLSQGYDFVFDPKIHHEGSSYENYDEHHDEDNVYEDEDEDRKKEEEDLVGRRSFHRLRLMNPFNGSIPLNIQSRERAFVGRKTAQLSLQQKNDRTGERGGVDGAQWEALGPYGLGGRTRALAIDRSDPKEKTFLAGGVSGGLWRSVDAGNEWIKVSTDDNNGNVSCLIQDTRPGKMRTWYYGTGEVFSPDDFYDNGLAIVRGNGLFKSTDGGVHWNALTTTISGKPDLFDNAFDYTWNLAIDPSNIEQDEVYAATARGILRSIDGGENWQVVIGGPEISGQFADVAVTTTGVVYATVSDINETLDMKAGIFRSVDGIHWENISPPDWPLYANKTVIGIAPSREEKVFFLTTTGQDENFLFLYDQQTWTNLSAHLPSFEYTLGNYSTQGSFCMYVKVDPSDENIVFLGGINLYRSTDGFTTKNNTAWIGGYDPDQRDKSKYPHHHPDQHVLAFFGDSRKMISAHDGGISITEDGRASRVKWASLNHGYNTTQFYAVALQPGSSSGVVLGGMQDNGSFGANHLHPREKWNPLLAGDGSFCAISNLGDHLYVSSQYGRIYRLDYTQRTYKGFARVDPSGPNDYLFVNPFILDPYNSNIMYIAGGAHIWRNDNLAAIPAGSNDVNNMYWKRIDATKVIADIITSLGISTKPSNILYYGTLGGRLYKITDAVENPVVSDITSSTFPNNRGVHFGYVSSIAVNPENSDEVLVTFSNYGIPSVFYTLDGGKSWTDVSGNIEENPDGSGAGPGVYCASMIHLASGMIYFIGTTSGLFYTTALQGERTLWSQQPDIGSVPVQMIVSRQYDGTVLAATLGNGIYKTQFSQAVPENFERLDFKVDQNFSNPLSKHTTTKIPVWLPEDGSLHMMIHTSDGRLVEEFKVDGLKTGYNEVPLKVESLSAGNYFYTVFYNGRKKIRRMMITE
jgi:photosystem II stability/assembly factor-like uncharacterized protein